MFSERSRSIPDEFHSGRAPSENVTTLTKSLKLKVSIMFRTALWVMLHFVKPSVRNDKIIESDLSSTGTMSFGPVMAPIYLPHSFKVGEKQFDTPGPGPWVVRLTVAQQLIAPLIARFRAMAGYL